MTTRCLKPHGVRGAKLKASARGLRATATWNVSKSKHWGEMWTRRPRGACAKDICEKRRK